MIRTFYTGNIAKYRATNHLGQQAEFSTSLEAAEWLDEMDGDQ